MKKSGMTVTGIALILSSGLAQGMANPASVFCEKMGGESILVKTTQGDETGMCKFANGNTFEEWTLFRMFNGTQSESSK